MKAVLISIQPKWCELIASGKKTVEVRKTKPKIATPFKCYIYCTNVKGRAFFTKGENGNYAPARLGNGKIIGEFICDRIVDIPYSRYYVDYYHAMPQQDFEDACLDMGLIDEYLLSKDGFGWHISDLKIYDKPKDLREFKPWNRTEDDCIYSHLGYAIPKCSECHECYVKRPPQSWMYVEVEQ